MSTNIVNLFSPEQSDIYQQSTWMDCEYTDPDSYITADSTRVHGSIYKTNYNPVVQEEKFGVGIYDSRPKTERKYRPSVYGITPSIIRPNKAHEWSFKYANQPKPMIHSTPSIPQYNLTMNKRY